VKTGQPIPANRLPLDTWGPGRLFAVTIVWIVVLAALGVYYVGFFRSGHPLPVAEFI
jgi:hypothetical protein